MTNENKPRCLVLGLDGLPFSLARELCREGKLPNLANLALAEQAKAINAELPELSPVNWTSFFTASGPEIHGIFGFTALNPKDYTLHCADFTWVQTPTIFDRLGEKGLISKIVNLPNTYPARPLKGMLISGFVAPDLKNAVYPPFLLGPLQGAGYILEADTHRGAQDWEFLLQELRTTLASRRKALDLFWPDLAWDLFVFVLTETDRLGHFLFPALQNPGHAMHTACLDFLQEWDQLIGEVLERYEALPEPKRLLVLADHGFTSLKTEVDLNAWLRQMGFLQIQGEAENEWASQIISPSSRAFALDPGRIYIHDQQRFARGQVGANQVNSIGQEIKSELLKINYQGHPVINRVWTREELYPGTYHPMAPDLICEPYPGFDLKGKFDRKEIFGFYGRQGCHTSTDAFFYDSLGKDPLTVRGVGQEVLDFFAESKIILSA